MYLRRHFHFLKTKFRGGAPLTLKSVFVNVQKKVFRNELISISFLVIYKKILIAYLQIYFSNLNNILINQKICANSIIQKNW